MRKREGLARCFADRAGSWRATIAGFALTSSALASHVIGCSDTDRRPLLPLTATTSVGDSGAAGESGHTSLGASAEAEVSKGAAPTTESGGPNTATTTPAANSGGNAGTTASVASTNGPVSTLGAAGHGGAAGAPPESTSSGEAPPCAVPEAALPPSTCASIDGRRFPYISFRSATDVTSTGLTVFATQSADHIAAVTWQPASATGQVFVDWSCFDYVPHIRRVAAHMHPDGTEVLASTADGKLYARLSPHGPWTDWALLTGPDDKSCILDVAAPQTADGHNYRFVNDQGVIFEMHVTSDSLDSFSNWRRVGAPGGSRIAALYSEGSACAVALNTDGLPEISCQLEPEPDSGFSEFEPLGLARPALEGVAADVLPNGEARAFGVDSEGTLWRLSSLASHWSNSWEALGTSSGAQRIVDVSVATLRDDDVAILGVTVEGLVLRRADTGDSFWQPLAM